MSTATTPGQVVRMEPVRAPENVPTWTFNRTAPLILGAAVAAGVVAIRPGLTGSLVAAGVELLLTLAVFKAWIIR